MLQDAGGSVRTALHGAEGSQHWTLSSYPVQSFVQLLISC